MFSWCLLGLVLMLLVIDYLKVMYKCVRSVHAARFPTGGKAAKKPGSSSGYEQAPGPLPWPVIGNLHLLRRHRVPFQAFTELVRRYGDIYSLTLGTTRCLIVNNLKLIHEVLNQNGKFVSGRPDFLRYHALFGGNRNNSLALCDWSILQQKRRNIARKHCSPRISTVAYQKMSDIGCFEIQEFIKHIEYRRTQGIPAENLKILLQQAFANMFTNYMCSMHFDYEDSEFRRVVEKFDEIFWEINQGYAIDFMPWLLPFYNRHIHKLSTWSQSIRKFILERIIHQKELNLNSEQVDEDFTDALLRSLSDQNDHQLDRNTIMYMLEDFIGGHSAIGNLMMLSLAYIVQNPEVGERIQAEVDKILNGTSRCIGLEDIYHMPYTLSTLYEVLRYSSSPIVPHVSTEDIVIGGYGVTKDTVIFINNYILNTSSVYWKEPEKFDPCRFLDLNFCSEKDNLLINRRLFRDTIKLKKKMPYFLPFSMGKRTCIGQNLVKNFGFIALANIMSNFDVVSRDPSSIRMYPACVALPTKTFNLELLPRCHRKRNELT